MKNNKLFLMSGILLFLLLANSTSAAVFYWMGDDLGGDGFSWANQQNWSTNLTITGPLPGSSDIVELSGSRGGSWPVIQSATTANPWGIWCGYSNSLGVPTLSINWYGILNVSIFKIGFVADGKLIVNGGEVNISSECHLGDGNEWGYGHGTINIYSGTISTPVMSFATYSGAAYDGGTGSVNIIGGIINADSITHLDSPGSFINIEAGKLVLDGDVRTQVDSW
ncbi:hypothetical protein KAH27_05500, partial [bacterium]|nr:hypothetical protein [bacterium]